MPCFLRIPCEILLVLIGGFFLFYRLEEVPVESAVRATVLREEFYERFGFGRLIDAYLVHRDGLEAARTMVMSRLMYRILSHIPAYLRHRYSPHQRHGVRYFQVVRRANTHIHGRQHEASVALGEAFPHIRTLDILRIHRVWNGPLGDTVAARWARAVGWMIVGYDHVGLALDLTDGRTAIIHVNEFVAGNAIAVRVDYLTDILATEATTGFSIRNRPLEEATDHRRRPLVEIISLLVQSIWRNAVYDLLVSNCEHYANGFRYRNGFVSSQTGLRARIGRLGAPNQVFGHVSEQTFMDADSGRPYSVVIDRVEDQQSLQRLSQRIHRIGSQECQCVTCVMPEENADNGPDEPAEKKARYGNSVVVALFFSTQVYSRSLAVYCAGFDNASSIMGGY